MIYFFTPHALTSLGHSFLDISIGFEPDLVKEA